MVINTKPKTIRKPETPTTNMNQEKKTPVKRIELKGDALREVIKRDPNFQAERAKQNQTENNATRLYDNGEFKGLRLPNGTIFNGTEEEARAITRFLNRKKAEQQRKEKIVSDTTQQFADEQLREETLASLTPPNVTPDQLSQIGNQTVLQPDALTQDIQKNISSKQQLDESLNDPLSATPKIANINKLTAFAGKIPYVGEAFIDFLSQNKDIRNYLQDYSNEDNFKVVETDIQNAQNNMRLAIRMANQPGDSQDAIKAYNEALTRLNRANAQLKLIESSDQRAYVEKIKRKRIELENFLSYNVPQLNTQMRNSLIKPDPAYYDSALNNIMQQNSGGFSNAGN